MLSSSSRYWYVYLYDNTGVTELLRYGRLGNTESATTDYVSIVSGTYYVKVTKDSYSGVDYSLCVVEAHDHQGSWINSVEPTCTVGGTSTRTCKICGAIETRDVESLGHNYDSGKVIKKAGIAQKGETEFTCTVCGEHYIEKDGHLLWVIPVICVGGLLVIVGVFNYIRIIRKKRV